MLELLFLLLLLSSVPVLKASDPISEIITAIKNGIKSVITTVFGGLGSWFNEYIFKPLGEGVSSTIKSVFGTLTTYIRALGAPLVGVWDAATRVWTGAGSHMVSAYGPLAPIVFAVILAIVFVIGVLFIKKVAPRVVLW